MPRFGKDKSGRNEELDRQAAEEVERLTRRGGPPGMGGGGSGTPEFMSSPLDMVAAEMAEKPRPSMRRQAAPRKAAAKPQQAFTPMPSGSVGSSFGPGGLNPGPRGMAPAAPPPAFGGGTYDDDYGGPVTGPPVYNAEPDEDEEMTITELALMDQAAHTGHRPEDLVMQYDSGTAEEMRDAAMRRFRERQQARRPGPSTNSPFAPAGMRRGASGGGGGGRSDDPAVAGGALAQRLANRRRREEEEARRAKAAADPGPAASAGAAAKAETADDEGALARVLARRRQALGVDAQTDLDESARDSGSTLAPGRRHAGSRATNSPGLRAVPQPPQIDDDDADAKVPAAKKSTRPRKAASKGPAAKKVTKRTAEAPAGAKAKAVPATKTAPATKKATPTAKAAKANKAKAAPAPKAAETRSAPVPKATKARKSGASLAKAPATKTAKAGKARTTGKAKTVFCIECGEKNPAIAKFCFNCGNRLAVPEG